MTIRRFATAAIALLAFAAPLPAQLLRSPAEQVYDDARVIRRIAEIARREMPRDLLRTITDQSLDALRGKRGELEYQYASWQRVESGTVQSSATIGPGPEPESLTAVSVKGDLVYRLRIEVPKRRKLFFGNDRVWVDRIETRYTPIGGAPAAVTVAVNAWFDSGSERVWDLPVVASEAEATVFVRPESERSLVVLTLSRASLVDNPDSPWFEVVRRVKSTQDAIREGDYRTVRNLQDEITALLEGRVSARGIAPLPPPTTPAPQRPGTAATPAPAGDDLYFELSHIRELLNGNDDDRREAVFRLERLIQRMRPAM